MTDNPIVFEDEDTATVAAISSAQPVAFAADTIAMAMCGSALVGAAPRC